MVDTSNGWALKVERGPNWLLVNARLLGGVSCREESLLDTLWSVMEEHFTYRMVLELEPDEVLDRRLIGDLARLNERARSHEGVLRLCGLSPQNRRLLHREGEGAVLAAYRDRREAVFAGRGR
jgi:hypothetical protein